MSITKKMTVFLFLFVAVVLLLNLGFNNFHSRIAVQEENKAHIMQTTKQIGLTLAQSRNSSDYAIARAEEEMRMAAELAARELAPELDQISSGQLAELSRRTGISGFSLLYKMGDTVTIGKSTDPQRLGAVFNRSNENYNTLNDLLDRGGAGLADDLGPYWVIDAEGSAAPLDASSLTRTGFYYDGKRDYIINVFLRAEDLGPAIKQITPQGTVDQIIQNDSDIVEITGWPAFSAQEASDPGAETTTPPVLFGTSRFSGNDTADLIKDVAESGTDIVRDLYKGGKHYIQSYAKVDFSPEESYILRVVYSYDPITGIQNAPKSATLPFWTSMLALVVLMSFLFSQIFSRPFSRMLKSVKAIAGGDATIELPVSRTKEFGLLAVYINEITGNIGEQKEALKQVKDENNAIRLYLDSIISQAADAIYISDWQGKVIRTNHAFEKLYGWTETEVVGKQLPFVPDWCLEDWEQKQDMLRRGGLLPWTETIRLRKDGSEVAVSISESPVFNLDGKVIAFTTISKDMTEFNKLEELLRRSEKLRTVGQLAAGVAHEIRNPLTTLRGFLQLQQQTETLNLKHVDIMMSELDRINLIVGEFLILAKPQASIFQDKDIRFILGDVVSLLDSQAHLYGVEFVLDFAKEPLYVHCEENQLKQVFINILKNAIEAMPLGGGIGLKIMREGNNVLIGIIDEGEGIPYETLPKLGEPFFTSKEKGTGLGLMVSQRIIEAHKGSVNINSMLGWGTMVTITLPMVEVWGVSQKEQEG